MDINKLKRVREFEWEIPKSGDMLVPGRIFGNEKLVKEMDEMVWKQVSNVACLPGIVNASIAMPDAHWGYGFCIGGVAAFDPENNGVISVGGVGFDINCLSGDTKIITEHGYYKEIKEFENSKEKLKCMNLKKKREEETGILRFIKFKPKNKVYKIKTLSGREIIATEDHPFLTPRGMIPLRDLKENKIATYPFKGIKFETPKENIILNEDEILTSKIPFNKNQIIKELKKRKLLPLKLNSPKVPYLIKIIAYNIGDGTLFFSGNRGFAWFYGKKEDLELIRKDIKKLGFTPSKVYERKRKHKIETKYGIVKFEFIEHSFKVSSRAFVTLLSLLGAPVGEKSSQDFEIPEWIMNSPLWYKRLFLASYFGAEMTSPKTVTSHGYNFYMPSVSINKELDYVKSGKKFLKQIKDILREFGIRCSKISEREEYFNKRGKFTYRLKLLIHSSPKNLIRFYETIGFEYNHTKKYLSNVVAHYLRIKERILRERVKVEKLAITLYKNGYSLKQICNSLCSKYINKRFIERSIYENRTTTPRISFNFLKFEEFLKEFTKGLGKSGMVWDEIISKEEIKFDDYVYDFTVNHNDHNFVANNFVVSNCGVVTLKTNLTLKEVKPRIKQLIDTLFQIVPAGLGERGEILLSSSQLNDVFIDGAKWVVDNGYGLREDLEYIEENGRVPNANPENVSELAIKRERKQIGTLGSGNHYLEVQYVDEVYDQETAKKFGLEKEQILVSIHCGSRALGHQIGTDYLKILGEASKKYGIPIRERELVCAPINSPEGQKFFTAMNCGINYAFANRQVIVYLVRKGFKKIFPDSELKMLYNVGHNTCKIEKHKVNGKIKELYVHRKGSTRAFGPDREELPKVYRGVGQPVLIGGTMGTCSYILVGTKYGEERAFGSACHGSGRTMSRIKAKKTWRGDRLVKELEAKGIYIRAHSFPGLAEEAPGAYKDVSEVVDAVHNANLAKKVVKVKPIGNIKG